MSVTPFGSEGEGLPAKPEPTSDLEIFKPPLADFDFPAYERRQVKLDVALATGTPEGLVAAIQELQDENPDVGVKLNNFHNATLRGDLPGLMAPLAVMTQSVIEGDMPNLDFQGGVAPRAKFIGRNLRGTNFIDSVLTEVDFTDADLRGVDFANATLNYADFTGAKVAGADFSTAYMVGVKGLEDPDVIKTVNLTAVRTVVAEGMEEGSLEKFLASRFGDAEDLETIQRMLDPVPVAINQTIPRLQTKRDLRGLIGHGLRANDVNFSSSHLIGAHLEDFSGNGVEFRNTVLSGAVILRAVMRGADLRSAWAPGIIIEDTVLRGSNFTNANLVGAIMRGVDLREVEGLGAQDTNLEGIVLEDCKLPQGYGYNGIAIEATKKQQREIEE